MGERQHQLRTPSCEQALLLLAVGLAALAVGWWLFLRHASYRPLLDVQLNAEPKVWPPTDSPGLRGALWWETAVVVGYGVCLGLLADLARRLFYGQKARRLAEAALDCVGIAVVMDLLENVVILSALNEGSPRLLPFSAAAGVVKSCALVVAAPVGFASALVVLRRAWVHLQLRYGRGESPASYLECVPPSPEGSGPADGAGRGERWARGYLVPGVDGHGPTRGADGDGARDADGAPRPLAATGFCVSGGGVRSASVTLGALQGLRSELLGAQYLVSVSGGGYTAGALQLALQPPPDGVPGENPAAPETVLMPGTVEEDHVRRHSSYIADGLGQWLVSLGVLARNLLFSLALLAVTVVAVGFVAGLFYRFYRLVPIGSLSALRHGFFATSLPPYPLPPVGVRLALVGLGLATLGLYVVKLAAFVDTGGVSAWGSDVVRRCFQALLLVTVVGVAVPALLWASVAVSTLGDQASSGVGVVRGATGTVVFAYLATLVGVLWRRRESIGKQLGWVRSKVSAVGNASASLFQHLLVIAALVLVAVLLLLLLGAVAVLAADLPVSSTQAGSFMRDNAKVLVPVLVAFVVLGVTWLLVDQTWMSLHPFYRRRLASAFAVRPLRMPSGQVQARAYDYDQERTTLSLYGKRRDGFPEVVFAAAANLSGQERTPPGRRAVSFTMTGEWVGGPDVGYVRTAGLEKATSEHIQRDLTVQAAVAVSGAAFASAMGRQARAFQTFFALTNARLGTWLPNPAFLHAWATAARPDVDDWSVPQLPRLRRLNYLLREIAGSFPCDDRFLFVTDGGHYENLGLVELLRRRCTRIYCIDASGDNPPVAGTLAEAIDLAYEELGVTITLEDQWALVPGGGEAIDPQNPLAPLNGRLSGSGVIRGTICYPPESGLPTGTTGTLVVAKAVLTRDMPYPLLAHAVQSPVFPRDSTTDQWFDDSRFTAYKALGKELARQVREAERRWSGQTEQVDPRQAGGGSASGFGADGGDGASGGGDRGDGPESSGDVAVARPLASGRVGGIP